MDEMGGLLRSCFALRVCRAASQLAWGWSRRSPGVPPVPPLLPSIPPPSLPRLVPRCVIPAALLSPPLSASQGHLPRWAGFSGIDCLAPAADGLRALPASRQLRILPPSGMSPFLAPSVLTGHQRGKAAKPPRAAAFLLPLLLLCPPLCPVGQDMGVLLPLGYLGGDGT